MATMGLTEILDDTGASMARRVWEHTSGARVYECCEREDDGADRTRYQVIAIGGDCLGHHGSLALAAMACDGATPQQLADAAHGEAARLAGEAARLRKKVSDLLVHSINGAEDAALLDSVHVRREREAAHAHSAARDAQAWADRGPTEHGYWYDGQAGRTWRSVCMTKYRSNGRP